jgi:hypothetical protein
MTTEELQKIIEKYKLLSNRMALEDEEKSFVYDRFAEFLEDYPRHSGLDDSDNEENLWENFHEAEAEVNNYWDVAFPEGDEDDSINDYLTQD